MRDMSWNRKFILFQTIAAKSENNASHSCELSSAMHAVYKGQTRTLDYPLEFFCFHFQSPFPSQSCPRNGSESEVL